jgi:hypothetical protein
MFAVFVEGERRGGSFGKMRWYRMLGNRIGLHDGSSFLRRPIVLHGSETISTTFLAEL